MGCCCWACFVWLFNLWGIEMISDPLQIATCKGENEISRKAARRIIDAEKPGNAAIVQAISNKFSVSNEVVMTWLTGDDFMELLYGETFE